jgi:DNA-binding transcriptional MerR regulator
MAARAMMIGEAAKRVGVSADTMRHYERTGLLPRAPRTAGGYRYYSETAVARALLVHNAIRFGFSIKALAGFLHARDHGRPPCRSVRTAGERLLREMDRQLSELAAARHSIAETLARWDATLARTPDGSPAHLLADIPKVGRRTTTLLNPH